MSTLAKQAHALFEVKSIDEERRLIVGIASTPDPDHSGDEMDPKGAQFALPMPLRWEHQSTVGEVFAAEVTAAGIQIQARIPVVKEAGALKDQVDFAWQSVKYKLARGLSIGWKPIEAVKNKAGGLSVRKWFWGETSIVSIPMNARATISLVKSTDAAHLAALGRRAGIPSSTHPGVAGSAAHKSMNNSERITELETSLRTKTDRMTALMAVRDTDGLEWSAEQSTEFDGLASDSAKLGADLNRYKALEQNLMSFAKPAPMAQRSFQSQHITVKSADVPKGIRMGRYALALFAADGDRARAVQLAEKHWGGSTPEVALALKAAADLGVTTSDPWGGELTPYRQVADEFVEMLRAATIVGRIPGLRRVPFNIKFPVQTAGTEGSWVGEGGLKPVGKITLDNATLRFTKVAKIVAFSDEMQRFSSPGIEQLVRDDLIAGCSETIDKTFIDPAIVEVSDVRPASITNSAPNDAASGTDVDAFRADFAAALGSFAGANIPVNGLVLVTTPAVAANLALLATALGVSVFPDMTPEGGRVLGYTVIVSGNVPDGVFVFLKPSEIFLADDGAVNIETSNQATLVMDDGASPSSTTSINLWQQNARGVKAERFINWKRRRDEAVYYITNAVYNG